MSAEVKGTWFVTLETWSRRELPDALPLLADAMPRHGAVVREPQQGEWYPEDALFELFTALFDYVERDQARFIECSRSVSHEGVGRFFRVLLGLTSPGFLLRQVPTMWRRLRRGDQAIVEVESGRGSSVVRYANFAWLDHDVYVWFTLGSLHALAELADPAGVRVELIERKPGAAAFRVWHA